MENNGQLFAFPWEQSQDNQHNKGLTKREYIASLAMASLIAVPNTGITLEGLIKKAIEATDELLKQLDV